MTTLVDGVDRVGDDSSPGAIDLADGRMDGEDVSSGEDSVLGISTSSRRRGSQSDGTEKKQMFEITDSSEEETLGEKDALAEDVSVAVAS